MDTYICNTHTVLGNEHITVILSTPWCLCVSLYSYKTHRYGLAHPPQCVCVCQYMYVCVFVWGVCHCASLCVCLCHCVTLCVSLCVCVTLSVCITICVSLCITVCVSACVRVTACVTSASLCVCHIECVSL